jgi:maltose O-acetyltransferase
MGLIARISHRLLGRHASRRERMSATMSELRAAGMRIGDDVAIYNCIFDTNYPFLIEIGSHSIITHATVLAHDDSPTLFGRGVVVGRVKIGSRCFIGAGAIVMPGVTIGDGSIVGAHSVVTHDVAAGVVVVGNPARVICSIDAWIGRLDESGERKRLIPVSHDALVQTEAQSDELAMLVRASADQMLRQPWAADRQSGSAFAGVSMVDFAPDRTAQDGDESSDTPAPPSNRR